MLFSSITVVDRLFVFVVFFFVVTVDFAVLWAVSVVTALVLATVLDVVLSCVWLVSVQEENRIHMPSSIGKIRYNFFIMVF